MRAAKNETRILRLNGPHVRLPEADAVERLTRAAAEPDREQLRVLEGAAEALDRASLAEDVARCAEVRLLPRRRQVLRGPQP